MFLLQRRQKCNGTEGILGLVPTLCVGMLVDALRPWAQSAELTASTQSMGARSRLGDWEIRRLGDSAALISESLNLLISQSHEYSNRPPYPIFANSTNALAMLAAAAGWARVTKALSIC